MQSLADRDLTVDDDMGEGFIDLFSASNYETTREWATSSKRGN